MDEPKIQPENELPNSPQKDPFQAVEEALFLDYANLPKEYEEQYQDTLKTYVEPKNFIEFVEGVDVYFDIYLGQEARPMRKIARWFGHPAALRYAMQHCQTIYQQVRTIERDYHQSHGAYTPAQWRTAPLLAQWWHFFTSLPHPPAAQAEDSASTSASDTASAAFYAALLHAPEAPWGAPAQVADFQQRLDRYWRIMRPAKLAQGHQMDHFGFVMPCFLEVSSHHWIDHRRFEITDHRSYPLRQALALIALSRFAHQYYTQNPAALPYTAQLPEQVLGLRHFRNAGILTKRSKTLLAIHLRAHTIANKPAPKKRARAPRLHLQAKKWCPTRNFDLNTLLQSRPQFPIALWPFKELLFTYQHLTHLSLTQMARNLHISQSRIYAMYAHPQALDCPHRPQTRERLLALIAPYLPPSYDPGCPIEAINPALAPPSATPIPLPPNARGITLADLHTQQERMLTQQEHTHAQNERIIALFEQLLNHLKGPQA